jgi:hypothetical protein
MGAPPRAMGKARSLLFFVWTVIPAPNSMYVRCQPVKIKGIHVNNQQNLLLLILPRIPYIRLGVGGRGAAFIFHSNDCHPQ